MKILNKNEQPLLSRTEVDIEITYEGITPSRADIKKQIASQLNTDEKLVVVRKIDAQYGEKNAEVLAYSYKNEEDMKRIETENALNKGMPKEKKAEGAEAKPAEEKKEEAKPEEKKEEKPAEEKPAEEKKEEGKE
ncbi:30S ribosomal protein S24e [Nanoarchaeota archaeon]